MESFKLKSNMHKRQEWPVVPRFGLQTVYFRNSWPIYRMFPRWWKHRCLRGCPLRCSKRRCLLSVGHEPDANCKKTYQRADLQGIQAKGAIRNITKTSRRAEG